MIQPGHIRPIIIILRQAVRKKETGKKLQDLCEYYTISLKNIWKNSVRHLAEASGSTSKNSERV